MTPPRRYRWPSLPRASRPARELRASPLAGCATCAAVETACVHASSCLAALACMRTLEEAPAYPSTPRAASWPARVVAVQPTVPCCYAACAWQVPKRVRTAETYLHPLPHAQYLPGQARCLHAATRMPNGLTTGSRLLKCYLTRAYSQVPEVLLALHSHDRVCTAQSAWCLLAAVGPAVVSLCH